MTSDCSLIRLDACNDNVHLLSYNPMTEYLTSSQKREPSAHFLEEEEKGEGEKDNGEEEGEEEEVEARSSSGNDYRPFYPSKDLVSERLPL